MKSNQLDTFKTLLHKLIKEEIEAGDGEEKQAGLEKINYDLVLEPADLQSALSALSDVKNYGIYANNLRDPKIIQKIFGPSIPAQKANTAWRTWDTLNDEEKIAKASDIRNRVPDAWKQLEADMQAKFEEWMASEGEGSFLEFISTLNSTDFSDGVSIVSGSEITFTTLGKYNIAFSAQVIKTSGTSTNIWIWLRHNGVDVPNSATVLEMGNNNTYLVAAWNFFINVNSSPQQFQLMWYTPSANISIGAISDVNTPVGVPGVPSIILTVNQVG